MALSYLSVDRDQLFLLPPDMRDWLPEGHLAWFVIDVVERVDTSVLHARHPNDGVGRRAYDPEMMLALLVYAYCMGQRSSRQIERLCEMDVAFRVIAAGHRPDHTTIARFRQGHQELAVEMFTDVLVLCAASGLVRVGVVAIDGTKIAADASRRANRTREVIEAQVRAMFTEAAEVDEQEDRLFGGARDDELPAGLADRHGRGARLDAALKVLEAQRQARAEEEAQRVESRRRRRRDGEARGRPPDAAAVQEAEENLAREQARAAERTARWEQRRREAARRGRKPSGPTPRGDEDHRVVQAGERLERVRARATQRDPDNDQAYGEQRVNTTDPDSRLMVGARGEWVQGYNAQAAVSDNGVVLAAEVTQDHNDKGQCLPMMAATQANLDAAAVAEPIGVVLFDAGYLSNENITAPGPDRLIATGNAHKLRETGPVSGPPPPGASPIETMQHRLRTPDGAALYAKRQHTVEPVFGDAKHLRGFRRFSRRTLTAVDAEWKLAMTAHNIWKMFRHRGPLAQR